MEESLASVIRQRFELPIQDVRTYSPLALAYIGDAIYDVVIRTIVVEKGNKSSGDLHKIAIKYVNAGTQAAMIEALIPKLTEEEETIYKRGRNAKSQSVAKNATVGDYRKATGFEALMGYLYLTDRFERIFELIESGLELTDNAFFKR